MSTWCWVWPQMRMVWWPSRVYPWRRWLKRWSVFWTIRTSLSITYWPIWMLGSLLMECSLYAIYTMYLAHQWLPNLWTLLLMVAMSCFVISQTLSAAVPLSTSILCEQGEIISCINNWQRRKLQYLFLHLPKKFAPCTETHIMISPPYLRPTLWYLSTQHHASAISVTQIWSKPNIEIGWLMTE